MLENLSLYIPIVFGLTTALTLALFFWAVKNSNLQNVSQLSFKILTGLVLWLTL